MAKISSEEREGNRRHALTDSDIEGRNLFREWATDAGCIFRLDTMGNLFARCAGKNLDAPSVVSGSHLNTQPSWGRFDGFLRVLGSIEVVCSINDHDVETNLPI